jgi:hypothetical protein
MPLAGYTSPVAGKFLHFAAEGRKKNYDEI